MKVTPEKNEKVAQMIFASIFPLYLSRLEKNGRTKEEFYNVIEWFTGFDERTLQTLIDKKVTFRTFFQKAKIHPNAHLIKGVVCGYRMKTSQRSLTSISTADNSKNSLMNWLKGDNSKKH